MAEVTSTFQKRPCYRYIRNTDKLPAQAPAEAVCKVKLFNPQGAGTWWIASYDPESGECFGVSEIHEREAGYFYLPELVDYRGPLGLPIERDLYFEPVTVRELCGL